MGRKFCKTLYRIIEKKGAVRCIEDGCNGYIHKDNEELNNLCTDVYSEDSIFYQCNKNVKRRWEVIKNNIEDSLVFQKC